MNDFDIKNEKTIAFITDDTKSCCVCFGNEKCIVNKINGEVLSTLDIDFTDIAIPDNILIKSCCGVHYICICCLRRIINNYENHSINEFNSHITCPYPFEDCVNDMGLKNVFDHNLIKRLCKSEKEWNDYITHADRYAFPGFTIVKCPVLHYRGRYMDREQCNANVLLENNLIKSRPIGDLILQCDQNESCLRKSCFNCKKQINYYQDSCYECKSINENENPNVFNYFFNKNYENPLAEFSQNQNDNYHSDDNTEPLNYEESSYLYLNKEIDCEIAFTQIMSVIHNVDSYMICSICKISLYKTEKCNGLSHHNLERCYACGRIGYVIKGLGNNHWNTNGESGCFRFNTDNYIKTYLPEYNCYDDVCHSHDRGDCKINEHQPGIQSFEIMRKRAYVYHMIKSLLPEIRFIVYDKLYNELVSSKKDLLELLPYKQTFILLNVYKNHNIDYSEEIVYKRLQCRHPSLSEIFYDRNYTIPVNQYIETQILKDSFLAIKEPNEEYTIDLPEFTNNLLDEILEELNQNEHNSSDSDTDFPEDDIQEIIVYDGRNTMTNTLNYYQEEQTTDNLFINTVRYYHEPTRQIILPPLTLDTYSLLLDNMEDDRDLTEVPLLDELDDELDDE